jgi:hypothetical protein
MQVRTERKPPTVYRFSSPFRRPVRGRPAVGAVITLVAFLGSLLAATLGPLAGDLTSSPLLLLLMLIRG